MFKQMRVKLNRTPHSSWYLMTRSNGSPGTLAGSCGKPECSGAPQDLEKVVFPFPSANYSLPDPPLYQHTGVQETTKVKETVSVKTAFLFFFCAMASTKENDYTHWWLYPFQWMQKFITFKSPCDHNLRRQMTFNISATLRFVPSQLHPLHSTYF